MSCVVSDPFELRFIRVHPFSFDETFVFLCLWSLEPHDDGRHEIVVKGFQSIDKIRGTHRSFFELIYWIAISLLMKYRWLKCQCRFSQLLQKKTKTISRIWDLKNIDQTNFSYFSVRQIFCSSLCFLIHTERHRLRSLFLMQLLYRMDLSSNPVWSEI